MIIEDNGNLMHGSFGFLVKLVKPEDSKGKCSVDESLLNLFSSVERVKRLLIKRATTQYYADGEKDEPEYSRLRFQILSDAAIGPLVPEVVREHRDLASYWDFMKGAFSSHRERREFINHQFDEMYTYLERLAMPPSEMALSEPLTIFDWQHVQHTWIKMLARRTSDPDGAITAARSLIESVCKHILEEAGVAFNGKDDLPRLYFLAAECLGLAPNQASNSSVRRVLGNVQQIMQSLGELRNELGDAHGAGKGRIAPEPHLAELAINLAGSAATLLIAAWQAKQGEDAP